MSGQIFISYRREDSAAMAGRLYDRLSTNFHENQIFMDIDSIDIGIDFVTSIERSVATCDVLVAVIGQHWLISSDEEGRRRLDNPEDFVRIEIATALKRGLLVIPVLVDKTSMPRSGELPEDLKPLTSRHALSVSHTGFRADMERLMIAVRHALETAEQQRKPEERERLGAKAEERIRMAVESKALTLDLSGLRRSYLADSIMQLAQLRELNLGDNELSTLPEFVGQLSQLQLLDLSGNQLSTLPEFLGQLSQLRLLELSNNQLSALPESLGRLEHLRSLSVSNNDLSFLPESLLQLRNLEELYLHGNSRLDLPTEILGPDHSAVRVKRIRPARPGDILTYYFENQRAMRPLNEVKLIIVGRGQSGKSSIRDRLVFETFDLHRPETLGIQIDRWPLKCGEQTVLVRVWDFAGQEITHATHQFFLTERSIYLLVLDARADTQDRDADYWLRLISAFGKDSPVLVALNKSTEKPFDVDRFALQERYRFVRAFVATDCAGPVGIDELRQEIVAAIEELDAVRQAFPAVWTRLKDEFSRMKDNYLPFGTFRRRCIEEGEKDPARQEQLARSLHALGIVLYYADHPRLRDTTVLNPRWVTESIYKLLRLRAQPRAEGTLTLDEVRAALPQEKAEMVTYLIDLMRRFELCFPMGEEEEVEKRWLVPELLPRFQPPLSREWLDPRAVRLRYGTRCYQRA